VAQVHLPQGALTDADVHLHARVLDAVAGVVLHAGHDMALNPANQRCSHLADV
jgi:hypothetical protein